MSARKISDLHASFPSPAVEAGEALADESYPLVPDGQLEADRIFWMSMHEAIRAAINPASPLPQSVTESQE